MAELAIGSRSPLRVRLTETAGVWLLRVAPALEKRVDTHEQRGKRNKTERTHYTKI